MHTELRLALITAALTCSQLALPAQAQRARVFVASYGNDSNPCTFLSPCRNFQQAVNVVDAGGEVTAIDSAGFGPISISQPITITSPPGVEAGIVPTSGNPAITVDALRSVVQLRGLTLDGKSGGTNGISYTGAGTRVEIIDCLIHNFSADGIYVNNVDVTGFTSTIIISNTISSNNGANGINLAPIQSTLRGALDHVITGGNSQSGILISGVNATGGGFMDFTMRNSVSDDNSGDGIVVLGIGNVKVETRDSIISNNAFNGFTVVGAVASLYADTIAMNNAAFGIGNSGTLESFGNNAIAHNANASTGTLTPVGVQ